MKNQIQPVSADPVVVAERDKLARLRAELSELSRQHEAASAGGPLVRTAFDRAVDEVLGIDSPPPTTTDQDAAAERERVLATAVERQARAVEAAESKAGQKIAEACRPDYVNIVRRGAKAMAALKQFIIDEREFRDQLLQADVKLGGTIQPMALGKLIDEHDCDRFAAEAKSAYGVAL
jgi:hypothetical protein